MGLRRETKMCESGVSVDIREKRAYIAMRHKSKHTTLVELLLTREITPPLERIKSDTSYEIVRKTSIPGDLPKHSALTIVIICLLRRAVRSVLLRD